MKRYSNIYDNICCYDNLLKAHTNARRGKTYYSQVIDVDNNTEQYLLKLQEQLTSLTYKTSKYKIFTIMDKGKEREIYKLPYFPDRVAQWAIMLQIESLLSKVFVNFSCASIPHKGVHYALKLLNKYLKDKEGTKYCLKLDVRKFFPNVNHKILKDLLRKKFKDDRLLLLLDEIINSVEGESGLPVGNYTSQYFANFYLTYFDHWLKEDKRCKYVIRYMDDIIILHDSKEYLHKLKNEIENYLSNNLKLNLKSNWQIFPTTIRGIDFVGYRHFGDYILLRKSTSRKLIKKFRKLLIKCHMGIILSYSDCCTINSYRGWIMYCNGFNLTEKYINPLLKYCL